MLLVGDIGGTKTLLALYSYKNKEFILEKEATYASAQYPSLTDIIDWFLGKTHYDSIQSACFGVAGPVLQGSSQITNLDWYLEERMIAQHLDIPNIRLINDLEATAYGMLYLDNNDFCQLNEKDKTLQTANRAVIAAGTGLGEAILYWDGEHYHAIATEGGHCDFGPQNAQQERLLNYLRQYFPEHVSYERILSGQGLVSLYNFLRDIENIKEDKAVQEALAIEKDPNTKISEFALTKQDPLCHQTLELFTQIYAQESSNLVLKSLALGGLYIGGGIAPKILPYLQKPMFIESFNNKGRFHHLLSNIAIQVSLNPRTPLLGAAHLAVELIS